MANKKLPFNQSLYKVAIATTDELILPPVDSGHILCIQSVTYRDVTNTCAKIHFIKRGSGVDLLLAEDTTTTANVLYYGGGFLYFSEGERAVVRFTTCTIGDALWAYFVGYTQMVGPIALDITV
jgi:hypothetical protein